MGIQIERLTVNDADEALDFLNLVFSMAKYPHNFRKMLPKMWRENGAHVEDHIAVKREGRIRALVGVYPLPAHVAGEKLLFATMGNVATHPMDTGRGYMSALLDEAMKELHRMDADAARLGGLRQRYARYGYEPIGAQYRFALTAHNVKEYYRGEFKSGIMFAPIYKDDAETLSWGRRLYEQGGMWVDRTDEAVFYDSLTAWENAPWIALLDGERIGYLTASADGSQISELNADSAARAVEMLCAWLTAKSAASISFPVQPWQTELTRLLQPLCEDWHIDMPSRFFIRRWDRVAGAFLKLKQQMVPLPDGKARIGIRDYGTLRLSVKDGVVSAEKRDDAADILMDPREAARFLFGPLPPYCTRALNGGEASALSAWLPLPLGWNTLDRV